MGIHSPQLYHYLKKYQDDPGSRVFAPLAESYRKAGLIDEAIEIAKEGLQVHPQFVGGRVALARALFDKKEYEKVVRELHDIVQDVPDNLVAQRLVADSNLMLGRVAEALAAYKMLLYFSPSDPEALQMVRELEDQAYQKGTLVLQSDQPPAAGFHVANAGGIFDDTPEGRRDDWMRKVEFLQECLVRVERYRKRNS